MKIHLTILKVAFIHIDNFTTFIVAVLILKYKKDVFEVCNNYILKKNLVPAAMAHI